MKLKVISQKDARILKVYEAWYIMPMVGMILEINRLCFKVKEMKASGPNLDLLEVWVEEL